MRKLTLTDLRNFAFDVAYLGLCAAINLPTFIRGVLQLTLEDRDPLDDTKNATPERFSSIDT